MMHRRVGNSTHPGAYTAVRAFAIGVGLGSRGFAACLEPISSALGMPKKEEREKEKKNDLVKTPCKHANQTSWWYLRAER